MSRILVATVKPFAPAAIEEIRKISESAGHEFALLEKYPDQEALKAALPGVHALIVRSDQIDREVIASAQDLKIVVRAGAGYDNIDLKAASEKNIVVMNTPGQNANAVAELGMGMMVYLARNQFNGKPGTELMGKNMGIHAFGNVGKHVARIAVGFGMNVLAFDPFIDEQIISQQKVTPVKTVEELYKISDYVSLHIPANENTRQSINYDLLKIMPKNASLINTARKEVIHEADLMRIMEEREDFRYATDIAPDNSAELAEKFGVRYYATPKKMGAQTAEANINAGIAAANQINRFFEKGDITFKVN